MTSQNQKGRTILAIQNDELDPPHLIGDWLNEIGFEIRTLRAFAGEEVPEVVPSDICALMPLGGHMGALDDHIAPWLAAERKLLADAVKKDFPILAICLGAQLLAAATDGIVSRMKQNEIGIYEIQSVEADNIFNFGATALTTQWHEDYVSKLPSGAKRIATSALCPNQIYKMGSKTYALQSHPEVDEQIVASWERAGDNAYQEFGATSVLAKVSAAQEELQRTWKPIIQSWGKSLLN